jgi:hypothetical protein
MLRDNGLKRLSRLQVKITEKGARIGLRIYVYPDGHDNIQHVSPLNRVEEENCPVNNVDEAVEVFRELWKRSSKAKGKSQVKKRHPLLLQT